jgi:enoyl-CoA hydratase/carnithine racemase
MSDTVTCAVSGPVARLTLGRPAITMTMAKELLHHLTVLNGPQHNGVRVIVLTGSGKFFCTGMDLTAAPTQQGSAAGGVGEAASNKSFKPYQLFESVWSSPKPVVGVLNGPALGGGVGLLYACDVRVALKGSFIKFPEAALGIFPALISGYIAPQLGPYLTQSLMMTGQEFSADQLLAAGQITAVADSADQLKEVTTKIVGQLLSAPKGSHAGVKRIVRLICYQGEYHQEAMDSLLSEFGMMMRSAEARHGMKVFRTEKKTPDWEAYYKNPAGNDAATASKKPPAGKAKL